MRVLVLLACLSVGCLSQRPQPCESPPLLTGRLSVFTQSEELMAIAKYTYDAVRERIRLRDFGTYYNQTFRRDVLLLYRQRVVYEIDYKSRSCCKKPLNVDFHPLAIPTNSSLLGQVVLGSSSGPGQGILANTWGGELQSKEETAQYFSTVTEYGCVPVSNLFHSSSGWLVTSFYNNVIGLANPEDLIPPSFCKNARLENEEPVTFFSLF